MDHQRHGAPATGLCLYGQAATKRWHLREAPRHTSRRSERPRTNGGAYVGRRMPVVKHPAVERVLRSNGFEWVRTGAHRVYQRGERRVVSRHAGRDILRAPWAIITPPASPVASARNRNPSAPMLAPMPVLLLLYPAE